jgi:uncharacterized protein (DUF1778 family)
MAKAKKGSEVVAQTLRLTVDQNNLVKEAADLEQMSINTWAKRILISAAKRQIAKNLNESENTIG